MCELANGRAFVEEYRRFRTIGCVEDLNRTWNSSGRQITVFWLMAVHRILKWENYRMVDGLDWFVNNLSMCEPSFALLVLKRLVKRLPLDVEYADRIIAFLATDFADSRDQIMSIRCLNHLVRRTGKELVKRVDLSQVEDSPCNFAGPQPSLEYAHAHLVMHEILNKQPVEYHVLLDALSADDNLLVSALLTLKHDHKLYEYLVVHLMDPGELFLDWIMGEQSPEILEYLLYIYGHFGCTLEDFHITWRDRLFRISGKLPGNVALQPLVKKLDRYVERGLELA